MTRLQVAANSFPDLEAQSAVLMTQSAAIIDLLLEADVAGVTQVTATVNEARNLAGEDISSFVTVRSHEATVVGPPTPTDIAPGTTLTNLMEIVSPHGRGLGALFDSGKTNSDYPLMFAVLIALAALGIVLYYVVVALEKVFAGWAERQPH